MTEPSAGSRPAIPSLRPMHQADLPAVAAIMAGNALWQRYGVTIDTARHRLQSGLHAGASIAVAVVEDTVAGFVWYVTRGAFQRSGYIMLIGVDTGQQAQGIGRALLDHAEAALFAGSDSILLLVSSFNTAAQAFYRRHGYTPVGAIPNYVIAGVDELIFFKQRPPE